MAAPNQATAPTAATTEHAAPHGAFPPFDANTFASQLFWIAILFAVLYLLMSRMALPRVEKVLRTRHDKIAGDLAEAQRLRTESEEAREAFEKSLHDARNNAQSIAQKTRDELTAQFEARRKALEAELNNKIASAEETIRTTTAGAMASVRGIAADTTTAIVQQLAGSAPTPAEVNAALDRVAA